MMDEDICSQLTSQTVEKIGQFSQEEFIERAKMFHGCVSPGVLLGGIMVSAAKELLPEGILFDAICETYSCLPDAVQILTPCTIGNGWMRILDYGRYAVSLYDKYEGDGYRVYLDVKKLKDWNEVHSWFLKLKLKHDQDNIRLKDQILSAGKQICSIQKIHVKSGFRTNRSKGLIAICGLCGEAYPVKDGLVCSACQQEKPFVMQGRV
jgi:formylmethanofuran dehydrogenase subunit E